MDVHIHSGDIISHRHEQFYYFFSGGSKFPAVKAALKTRSVSVAIFASLWYDGEKR